MKKNITINMQGRLYAIDEDAYDLLKQCEDSLRNYFACKEGGHEIVDDIEARIAELFDEVVASGKAAIDISDVQDIIGRMGNPQEMDGTDDEEEAHTQADGKTGTASSVFEQLKRVLLRPGKRLYRDTDNKKVAGVMAGLAHYYGGDVTWWRLAAITIPLVLVCCHLHHIVFYWIVAYFILGITLPPAYSPEDRLRMNGRDVNPQNIAEEVTADSVNQAQPQPRQREGCLSTLGEMILFGVKLVMWLTAVAVVLGCLWLLVMLLLLLFVPSLTIFNGAGVAFSWMEHPWVGSIGLVSLGLFISLIVFGLTSSLRSRHNPNLSLSGASRLALALLLVASLTGAIACGTIIISNLAEQRSLHIQRQNEMWIKNNTHNGFYIDDDEWSYMKANGWTLLQGDNCNDRYTASGEYYTGNEDKRYLDCYDENGAQLYRMERTDSLQEKGTYTLTAVVRSDGPGAFVYALADGKIYRAEIPAEGNTGGTLWQEAKAATQVTGDRPARLLTKIAEANDGNGYGWCKVEIKGIKASRVVRYGVTTVPGITKSHFDGTWFSATDFRLAKD